MRSFTITNGTESSAFVAKKRFEASVERHDYSEIIYAFAAYYEINIDDIDILWIDMARSLSSFFNIAKEYIPKFIDKPIPNTLILKLLEFYKTFNSLTPEHGILFYFSLHNKKDFIENWEKVSALGESFFDINFDLSSAELKNKFQCALANREYTKALAIFYKAHSLGPSVISFSGPTDLIERMTDVNTLIKKIPNEYFEIVILHIKELKDSSRFELDFYSFHHFRRVIDTFYFRVLEQRENIENWEMLTGISSFDPYHVLFMAIWNVSHSSIEYLLNKKLVDLCITKKFWYRGDEDGYCLTRYGEDSYKYMGLTLPAPHFAIAILTRPDMRYEVDVLFNIINLFVSHQPDCLNALESSGKKVHDYLENYKRVKTRYLPRDKKKQFDLQWNKILKWSRILQTREKQNNYEKFMLFHSAKVNPESAAHALPDNAFKTIGKFMCV